MLKKGCETYAIVPVYNGAKTIKRLIELLVKQIPIKKIIVVNDGSFDNTKQEILKLKDIIYLEHAQNRGKGAALKTGISFALKRDCDFIITLDSDCQHNPEEIPSFIQAAKQRSADIIIGSRMKDLSKMPFHRFLSNKITSFLVSRRIKQRVEDSQSGYRIYEAEVFKTLNFKCNYFDFETEVILKAGRKGFRIGHVNIDTIYPQNGSSAIKVIDVFRFIKTYLNS